MILFAEHSDAKVTLARKLLRQGATASDMATALGYKDASSVRYYLKKLGLPMPSIKGTRYRPTHSDEKRQEQSRKMREWHATNRLQQTERGNREL